MKIIQRAALASDTDFCLGVHHRAYREVCVRQFGPWDEAVQDTFFKANWKMGGFEIILCDGVPCGYLRVEVGLQHVDIHEIVVDPDFQNQGIGTFLLRQFIAQAMALSLSLRLRTLHQNRALALYQRIGFKETARTETHTLLEWKLPVEN